MNRWSIFSGAGLDNDGAYIGWPDFISFIETLRAIELGRECDPECARLRAGGYIVGGISFDVNTPPNAHEVKHECSCAHGRMMAAIEEGLR